MGQKVINRSNVDGVHGLFIGNSDHDLLNCFWVQVFPGMESQHDPASAFLVESVGTFPVGMFETGL